MNQGFFKNDSDTLVNCFAKGHVDINDKIKNKVHWYDVMYYITFMLRANS